MMKNIVVEVCVKKDNKILMVQENRREKKGKWNMPAGKLEENEDIISACTREVKEETGVDVEIKNLIFLEEKVSSVGNLLILYFLGEYKSGNISFDSEEIANVKWMTIDDINKIGKENIRGGNTINTVIYFSNKEVFGLDRIFIENMLK